MFMRLKPRRQIKQAKKNIAELELRRSRSQAGLISAILKNEVPNDDDVDYFNMYTGKIDAERIRMHELMEKYDGLSKK